VQRGWTCRERATEEPRETSWKHPATSATPLLSGRVAAWRKAVMNYPGQRIDLHKHTYNEERGGP